MMTILCLIILANVQLLTMIIYDVLIDVLIVN